MPHKVKAKDLTLYKAGAEYSDTRSVSIAAIYAGLSLAEVDAKEAKEYKQLAAYDNAPVLNTPSGPISGDLAILRYVARCRQDSGLYGQSFYESGVVDQWLDFNTSTLEPACQVWILPVKGLLAWDGRAYAQAKKDVTASLKALDAVLKKQTYLVGERVTIADIAIATTLVDLMTDVMDKNFRKQIPNVNRWFDTIVHQAPCAHVFGAVKLAASEKHAPKPAKKKGGDKQQQQQGKQKQQQQQGKKKGGQQQQQQPAQPKKKVHWSKAIKTKMILDAEKKQLFLKKPINPEFFNEIWDRFDYDNYSCWLSLYNYNSDNVGPYFMACNQLGGFLQRSDGVRKYALGVMTLQCENDETPPWEVSGAWMFLGNEVPQEMKDNPDAEYYTWVKVDVTTPEGKKTFQEQFDAPKLKLKGTGKMGEVTERRFFK